jgi:hypothetical protein
MNDPKDAEEMRTMSSEEAEEEAAWKRFTAEEFLKGYAESDAIYDEVYGHSDKRARNPGDDLIEDPP